MKTIEATFTVTFRTRIRVPDNATEESVEERLADVTIPESEDCRYVEDSFEIDEWEVMLKA